MNVYNYKNVSGRIKKPSYNLQLGFLSSGRYLVCTGKIYQDKDTNFIAYVLKDLDTKIEMVILRDALEFMLFDRDKSRSVNLLNVHTVSTSNGFTLRVTDDEYAVDKYKKMREMFGDIYGDKTNNKQERT